MINLDLIRHQPEFIKEALRRRGEEDPIDEILILDTQRRSLVTARDGLRSQHNELSRQFAQVRKEEAGRGSAAMENRLRQEIQALTRQSQNLESEHAEIQNRLNEMLLFIEPNCCCLQIMTRQKITITMI